MDRWIKCEELRSDLFSVQGNGKFDTRTMCLIQMNKTCSFKS